MKKEEKKKIKFFQLDASIITASALTLVLTFSFFFLLARKTSEEFSAGQIIFALILSAIIILILFWLKEVLSKNPYLGLSIGLLMIVAAVYSLYIKFSGPYTNIFAISIVVVLASFVMFNFLKFKNN